MDRKKDFCDTLGLTIIGFMSLGYILLIRPFAEMHLQLPFLDFPIFVGEFTLFICLCLFAYKHDGHWKDLIKRQWLIIGYFAFVLCKALYGYWRWGPLAFRHAALLYYPIFIVFAYSFFRREFFTQVKSMIIAGILMVMFVVGFYDRYWTVSCFILAFILVWSIQDKTIRWILMISLFLVTPFQSFFRTSRMMMVSNFVSCVWLVIGLYLVLKIKRKIKVIVFIVSIIAIVFGIIRFTDKNAAKSIVDLKGLSDAFKYYEKQVVEGLDTYRFPLSYAGGTAPSRERAIKNLYQRQYAQTDDDLSAAQVKIYNPDKGIEYVLSGKMTDEEIERMNLIRRMRRWDPEARLRGQEAMQVRLYHPDIYSLYDRQVEYEKELKALDEKGKPKGRDLQVAVNNAVFRLFIWRDVLEEIFYAKPLLGFDFGKPLRSRSLEILGWASSEWQRDGWIAMHNSYLHIIYRTGLVGIVLIGTFLFVFIKVVIDFVRLRSIVGVLLVGVMINWFVAANFLLIFELPYTAIPIWSLFGVTLAYRDMILQRNAKKES